MQHTYLVEILLSKWVVMIAPIATPLSLMEVATRKPSLPNFGGKLSPCQPVPLATCCECQMEVGRGLLECITI